MTSPDVLALFGQETAPSVLARCEFYIPAASRDGASSGREPAGGVILHKPTAAILLPTDFPPLSRRRPDFPGLRHVLVRFSFMLDRLPPRHAYESATLTVTLDDPSAAVLAQRPSLVTITSESADSTTTQLSAALDGLARLSAQRTTARQTARQTGQLPLVTGENRGPAGFGWHYQAHDGLPLLPQVTSAVAVIELPHSSTELAGTLSARAVISAPRFGVLVKSAAAPAAPPVPFLLPLGAAS